MGQDETEAGRCSGSGMATDAGDARQLFLERELDQIFFGGVFDETDANAEAATRGVWDQRRRDILEHVCTILDEGLEAAREKIIPTTVIDFLFCDNHGKNCKPPGCSLQEPHIDLKKEDGLFERGWVFEVEGLDCNTRLMVHGRTFLAWSARGEIEVKNRADKLTSVNWRIAEYARNIWSQDLRGQAYLPTKDVNWRQLYRQQRHDPVLWSWREWSGDGRGFPSADLSQQDREPDAGLKLKYTRVQTLLRLADEAEVQETYSKRETNKTIRSHGQVVSEMDITPFITRRLRRDFACPRQQNLHSAQISSLPHPAPVPSPFRVLLIGANFAQNMPLKIKEECQAVRQALENRYGADAWRGHVEFRIDCVADASSFMSEVMQAKPSVLMLSSHGETHGIWLSQGLIEARDLVEALEAYNRISKAEEQIRLLVINACNSGPLAEQLSGFVDFVIGHGTSEVFDEDAIKFSTTLFRALGEGLSLDASFKAAKLASNPFKLYSKRFSPLGFFLPIPGRQADILQAPEINSFPSASSHQTTDVGVGSTDVASVASTDGQRSQTSRPSAGHPSSTPAHETVPQIEGYIFEKKLGAGGQGTVWQTRCTKPQSGSDTKVAIKVCQSKYEWMQNRKVTTLHALRDLKHPNVVRFIEYLEQHHALVMEYIDGRSLKTHLCESNGKLEWEEASIIMRGVLSGLDCLHSMTENPILHGDIAPSNIMLRDAPVQRVNQVVLVDFGLSKRVQERGQTITQREMFTGTAPYLSVEVVKSLEPKEFDTRVDVWAAGVLMYEMLAGRRPFSGNNDLQLFESIKNETPERIPKVGSGVDAFLHRALEKKREARFTDASDMLAVFEQVCKNRFLVPEHLDQPQRPPLDRHEARSQTEPADLKRPVNAHGKLPVVVGTAMPEPGSPSLTDNRNKDEEDATDMHQDTTGSRVEHCEVSIFLPFEDFDFSTNTATAISNITPGRSPQELDKAKRVMTVFGIGIDIDKNLDSESQIEQSLRFGSGVGRVESLHQKLFDASFDLSLVNCHFKKNPDDQKGLLDAMDAWKKELESSPLVPEVVLFFVSVHEFKETEDGSLYLMPSRKAATTDHGIKRDGVPFQMNKGKTILRDLHDLEGMLKRKHSEAFDFSANPHAPKDLVILLIIDTMTGPVLKLASQLESSQIVMITTGSPKSSASDPGPHSLEWEKKKCKPEMSHLGSREREKLEIVKPIASATHPVQMVLDRVFEPGMALSRSLQQLEEDCDSIENWKSIPEDFALRKSCKFEWRLDRDYIHVTISHVMSSTTTEMNISEKEENFKDSLIGTIKAQVEEGKSRFAGLSIISQPSQSSGTESECTSGLKWENAGTARPSQGREITISLLANTLPNKTEFSQQEWESFGIHNLHTHNFIKSGASYFKPAGALIIYSPQSGYASRCEDQIFSILARSLVYVPILNLNQEFRLQEDRCSLILLQHILAIELLGRKESALRAIFPVVMCASRGVELPEECHQLTYKVARILLRRIGIDPKKRTVRDIFSELMKGHETVSPLSIVKVDVQVETKKLAQLMLEQIETQIKKFKTVNLKVCCPQGEEVINWLQFIRWETMSATFAERGLCSLPDIMNLPKNALLEICQKRVETDSTLSCTKEELYTQLNDCRSELTKSRNKFHEESKKLQDRLDGFRDKEISWANALFAQHSMEILVTKPLSLILLFLLSAAATGFLGFDLYFNVLVLAEYIPVHYDKEIRYVWANAHFRQYTIQLISSGLSICALLSVVWNLGCTPWKTPKIIAQNISFWLSIGFGIFSLRQAALIAQCFFFSIESWQKCPATKFSPFILECLTLGGCVVLLLVLIICAQYFAIFFLVFCGLVVLAAGTVYLVSDLQGSGHSNFDKDTVKQFDNPVLDVLVFLIIVVVLVGMMLLAFRKYLDAVKLKNKQMEPMKEYDQEWHKLLQGRKVTFSRAKIVCPRNTEEHLLVERIKGFATDFHISRVRTSRAGPLNASWFTRLLARIRAMVGTRVEIAVSLCAKRNCSEDRVQQDLHSAMSALLPDGLATQLSAQAHRIPASQAKLNILCDKIKDEISAQMFQEVTRRTQQHTPRWLNIPGLTRKGNMLYSLSGKRLQHEQDISTLFRDAQRLNNVFHTEIKSLLQSEGDSCEFIPGPIKTPSRAIEKVQFNLEVGFKDAHIVPCQEWEAVGVQRHICEVQVLPKSFSEVLRKHEYRILRDIAGK